MLSYRPVEELRRPTHRAPDQTWANWCTRVRVRHDPGGMTYGALVQYEPVTESWWLKFERAQEHRTEAERMISELSMRADATLRVEASIADRRERFRRSIRPQRRYPTGKSIPLPPTSRPL